MVIGEGLRRSVPAWLNERHLRPPSIIARPAQAGAARPDRGCGRAAWAALNRHHPQDRGTREHDCRRSRNAKAADPIAAQASPREQSARQWIAAIRLALGALT